MSTKYKPELDEDAQDLNHMSPGQLKSAVTSSDPCSFTSLDVKPVHEYDCQCQWCVLEAFDVHVQVCMCLVVCYFYLITLELLPFLE